MRAIRRGAFSVLLFWIAREFFLGAALAQLPDDFNPQPETPVFAVGLQADGKILAAGNFFKLGGQLCYFLGRLHPDGNLDSSFNVSPGGGQPSFVVQTDGKILTSGSHPRRLNSDGTLDSSYSTDISQGWAWGEGVQCLGIQPDGKILMGGIFTTLCGQAHSNLGRLNPDGSLDASFNPSVNAFVRTILLQPDGKILVGGDFTRLNGEECNFLGRLNPDGSRDSSFNPNADGRVGNIALQADGKILVGGGFAFLGNKLFWYLGRLNPDGSPDESFYAGCDWSDPCLAVQANGKILAGGAFTKLERQKCNRLGRILANGAFDTTFISGADTNVNTLAIQPDGKILAGGDFTSLGGQARSYLGRLNNNEPATENLTYDGSTIRWQRGGSSPEVWRTTFEATTNNADWTLFGAGVRVTGGWQLTGVTLPSLATIRARGFTGNGSGSCWFLESRWSSLPVVLSQPVSCTNQAGSTATLQVAAGIEPLSYQWFKDGLALTNGGVVLGAQASTLSLGPVFKPDEGAYFVVASNASGSVTSTVARLTVWDPVITLQPAWQPLPNGSATLSVAAAGTPPLWYQWLKDGFRLAGATNASLGFAAMAPSDSGNYTVVITNTYGCVTSSVAALNVKPPPAITTQPQSQSKVEGTSFILSVTATGSQPLSYQWQKNGTPIPSATSASFNLPHLALTDAGNYTVIITNAYGSATSSVATLTVLPAFSHTDGLVAYYPFSGDATDQSGNRNHGMVSGASLTTDRFGHTNSAYYFNGSSYIHIPPSATLNNLTTATVSYWTKYYRPVSGFASVSTTFGNGMDSLNGDCLFTYATSNLLYHIVGHWNSSVGVGSVITTIPYDATAPLASQPYVFITVVVDSTNVLAYKNGVLQSTVFREGKNIARPNVGWYIGSASGVGYFLNGMMDDIRFYNRALSGDEVFQLYLLEGGAAPVITPQPASSTNEFGFNIYFPTNSSVVVETCTNLATPVWTPLATNTLVGGASSFSDAASTNYPSRYYRVRTP